MKEAIESHGSPRSEDTSNDAIELPGSVAQRVEKVTDPEIISPERRAELQSEILSEIRHASTRAMGLVAKIGYLEGKIDKSSAPELKEKLRVTEAMYRELLAAQQKFWQKIKLGSGALLILFGTPTQDHKNKLQDPGAGSYAERTVARNELQNNGITRFQRDAYIPKLNDSLAEHINPFKYSGVTYSPIDAGGDLFRVLTGYVTDAAFDVRIGKEYGAGKSENQSIRSHQRVNRIDAWHMYLGMPQLHRTFDISEYRPEKSHDDRYYYKIQTFILDIQRVLTESDNEAVKNEKPIELLLKTIDAHQGKTADRVVVTDTPSNIMGSFTLSKGHDEKGTYVSYWDRWDLENSLEGSHGHLGKPFEIYDRIYYDPKTLEVLP